MRREVAAIHAADLRNRDVAFIDENQRIVGNIFKQGRRRLAGFAAREIARIIFDACAGAGCFQHFQIESRALIKALGFQQAACAGQFIKAVFQLLLD